jgi:hypothetical protein
MVNQAAAKWSGFQPSLMNMVKPIETPNPVAMAAEAIASAPKNWYDVARSYEALKSAKQGDNALMQMLKKQHEQEVNKALNANGAGTK